MSYPPLSNYYGSAGPSQRNVGYVDQSTPNSMYPSSMSNNNESNVNYTGSPYNYTGPISYESAADNVSTAGTAYSSTGYGYPRSGGNAQHDASLNDSYSNSYYGRNTNVGQSHSQSQQQTEGLNSLAYASGLESTNPRTRPSHTSNVYGNVSQSQTKTQSHSRQAPSQGQSHHSHLQQQQQRVKSPIETQNQSHSRYSTNPPPSTSYPMQQQASASSTSSHQLAENAAAALAAAVNRRYPGQQSQSTSGNTSTSPQITNARANAASRHTQSPQMNSTAVPYPAQSHRSTNSTTQKTQATNHNQTAASSYSGYQASQPSYQANNAQSQYTAPRRNIQETSSIANLVSAAHDNGDSGSEGQSSYGQGSAPSFIDPTAIFDPYQRERERRRQEAEKQVAEANHKAKTQSKTVEPKNKSTPAQKTTQASQNEKSKTPIQTKSKTQAKSSSKKAKQSATKASKATPAEAPSAPESAPPVDQEADMAAELKAMMDKMKAFQSKDPSLFKKLWNDMKQPAAASTAASSTVAPVAPIAVPSPSPQITSSILPTTQPSMQAHYPMPPTPLEAEPQDTTDLTPVQKGKRQKKPKVDENGEPLRLNGWPVVVENNPEGLPDLGRFPAERRIRHKYAKPAKEGQMDGASNDIQITNGIPTIPGPGNTPVPVPAVKPVAGTVWPPEKRNALTAAALKSLRSNPENAGVQLTEDELRSILEQNPSYVTLCEILESRGFKLHRGQFARELLTSVPDLKPSATPATPTASAVQAPVGHDRQPATPMTVQGQPAVPMYGDAPYTANNQMFLGQGVLYPAGSHGPPSARPNYQTPKQKGVPARPEPAPGSKAAAAKKRDFSELIDMTDLDDDENYVMPDKHARYDGPDSDAEMEDVKYQNFAGQAQPTAPMYATPPNGWYPPIQTPMRFNAYQPPAYISTQSAAVVATPEAKPNRAMLAKSLDKTAGLKKEFYDPRTVARDILIASGRHPIERPLNVHLAGMLGRYIELESDVSTLEWDEIDPGGPPLRKEEVTDVPISKPKYKMGDRAARRPRRPRPTKTREPEEEKPDSIDATKQNESGVIVASGVNSKPQAAMPAPAPLARNPKDTAVKQSSGLRHSLLATDAQATPATFDPTRAPVTATRADTSQPAAMDTPPMPKRRGRPPGSKNKYSNVGGLKTQAAAMAIPSVKVPVRELVRQPMREPTPVNKDRFKCKWRKCQTVLHNLNTLRHHIGRVHRPNREGPEKEGYTCWWKKCQYLKSTSEGDWVTTKTFQDRDDWLKHIEREHVAPIALKYGDGPSTSHTDPVQIEEDRRKYTANSRGQITTPIISLNAEYPKDTVHLPELTGPNEMEDADRTHYRKWFMVHKVKLGGKDESEEVIRALTQRKQTIGPGLDRGGCTLITEEMQDLFVQNPGIRRTIGDDE